MLLGVVLSVFGSFLFAGLYYYASLLAPLDGMQIYAWRMVMTIPSLTLLMWFAGMNGLILETINRLKQQPILLLGMVTTSALIGVQVWLFMWAPINGRGLAVSLGYFLLPLTLMIFGRWVYGDQLSLFQKLATFCACLGVLNQVIQVGAFSWETLLVCLGYPFYFMLRRRLNLHHLGGLWFDMVLMLPVVIGLFDAPAEIVDLFKTTPRLMALIPLLGAMSALALICFTLASRDLTLSLFGLLGFIEPVLLVGVSLLLGEQIADNEWATYMPIWLAVLILVAEGGLQLFKISPKK